MKYSISINTICQVLLMAVQIYNQSLPLIPPKYQPYGVCAVGIIQAVLALLAHYRNPDGTPAAVAYLPATDAPTK